MRYKRKELMMSKSDENWIERRKRQTDVKILREKIMKKVVKKYLNTVK